MSDPNDRPKDDDQNKLPPASGEFSLGKPEDPEFQHLQEQPLTASGSEMVSEAGRNLSNTGRSDEGKKEPKFKPMTWKGFEEEEEPEETVPFGKRHEREEAEMDMTPMVDVTFLLLIFFIVTAAFQLQKAIEQPKELSDQAALIVMEPDEDKDTVDVYVDENDNYYISSGDTDEEEAAGKVQMWQAVKRVVADSSARKLTIKVHEDSTHGAKVYVWDAGVDARIAEIAIQVVKGRN